jgi:hypothetical protein
MPLLRLALHVLSILAVLLAALDKELWAVIATTEMSFQILPATVGFECASGVRAAVGAESLVGMFC